MPLQPINANPAVGTVDDNGNVELKFPNVPSQLVWTASVSVPGSTPDIRWSVFISGVPAGTGYGANEVGPLNVPPAGQITLTASNLAPGAQYTAIVQGSSIEQDLADPTPAALPASISAVSVINEEVFVVGPVDNTGGTPTQVFFNVPPAWSVLHLLNTTGSGCRVTIEGVISGFDYCLNLSVPANEIVPVLIDPAMDNQLTMTVLAVGSGLLSASVTVTAQLNSSVFAVNNAESPLFIAPGSNPVGPGGTGSGNNFDVVPYGGLQKARATTVGAGVPATLLPAPIAGTTYRLHRCTYAPGAGVTQSFIYGATSALWVANFLSPATGKQGQEFDGDLWDEAIDFETLGGTGSVYMSYDIVATPNIG